MSYHKYSFIFVISMVELVGFDVYMSQNVNMKIRTLTTSSDLALCIRKLSPATKRFIWSCSIRITQIQPVASWYTKFGFSCSHFDTYLDQDQLIQAWWLRIWKNICDITSNKKVLDVLSYFMSLMPSSAKTVVFINF